MPPRFRPHVASFFHHQTGRVRYWPGVGHGPRIVSQHDGRVEVRSTVGQGSTFTVLLPPRPWDSIQDDAISSRKKAALAK